MQLSHHTFLITGGSSGLGAACARRFVRQGANVVIGDLQQQAGEELAKKLGEQAKFVAMDVTDEVSVRLAIEKADECFSGIAGVVNCAGILAGQRVVGRQGPHDLELFSRVVQVNLIGTFNVLRLAAVEMIKREPSSEGERGVIINTASISAEEGQIGQAAYAASKGGVAAMTGPIARELAEQGIRVVAISPGVFGTEMIDALPEKLSSSLKSQTVFPPRFGKPDEFAALAQHIVENPMLNATVIRLDGGMRMGSK